MGDHLNVRRILTEEFKKEFRRLSGGQYFGITLPYLKKLFDIRAVQERIDEALDKKEDPQEKSTLRKYHRNNLRYLAKYFAETLSNQLKSSGVSLAEIMRDDSILKTTLKTFKSNPQCKVYH